MRAICLFRDHLGAWSCRRSYGTFSRRDWRVGDERPSVAPRDDDVDGVVVMETTSEELLR